ncbi:carbon-nitrogen hydrolase family protein [Microbulbifer bruguierae]|uniref:Carbon-nitrogen hydrolase family protein n=1 Tax=Microbulbifer bruguierae TaxID=3029061 RepID=A0ABY8N8K9_9GAMM|nr:carbon-nitrogen hydrolase family protein [Microbulbifer bruguierae]WGL15231.1 carbon-nitrogen hydrolase family protein [Microbulbifer bruguierae]
MKNVCVAAVQMVSGDNVKDNLIRAKKLVADAANRGAKLVLLPENFAHLSGTGSFSVAEHFVRDGNTCAELHPIQYALKTWSAELGIWLVGGAQPLLERPDGNHTEGERSRSACLVYDDQGHLQARYDKMHLFDVDVADAAGRYRESATIEAGESPCVANSSWAGLGLTICFDLRFPELYRHLAMAGAEVFLVPAAFTYTTGEAHWMTLLRARAIENGCYIIAANQGGSHSPKRRTWGHSAIIDPWGEILAEAGEGESVITAVLDAEKLTKVRQSMPLLSMRRL